MVVKIIVNRVSLSFWQFFIHWKMKENNLIRPEKNQHDKADTRSIIKFFPEKFRCFVKVIVFEKLCIRENF